MSKPTSYFSHLLLIVTCLFVVGLIAQTTQTRGFGSNDFIEYYSAYQLFRAGHNPYDPSLMLELQRSLGQTDPSALMMWNPPWLLVIMSPILTLDYHSASIVWIFVSSLLLLSSAFLWCRMCERKPASIILPCLLVFSFAPNIYLLALGQVSALVLFGIIGSVSYAIKNEDRIAGILLSLTTIKPHVCYLFYLVFFWWIIKSRRLNILVGFLTSTLVLIGSTAFLSSHSLTDWIFQIAPQNSHSSIPVVQWKVPTLVGIIRSLLSEQPDLLPVWPIFVVPGVTAILLLAIFVRSQPKLDWAKILPALLCLSYFTSPFGWLFDAVLLLPMYLEMACAQSMRSRRSEILLICAAVLQILTGYCLYFLLPYQHQYFWFPVMLFVLYFLEKLNFSTALKDDRLC